jgi:adenosylcobinamide-phosphate synthase
MGIEGLVPSTAPLLAGLLLDAIFGDPQLRYHPIRLLGITLSSLENILRRTGLNGYIGGCVLFLLLVTIWVALPAVAVHALFNWNTTAGMIAHAVIIYVCVALRDLIDHVRAVQHAARRGSLSDARRAIGMFVGRDTEKLDLAGCRRAAIESLSESLVDGFLSALFWYVLGGLPGILLFKVVSTMDSMVGYKTSQYLQFGWCGARLDDLMNYVPARLTWILLGLAALPFAGLSAVKGWRIGLQQHAIVPGPNPGWSEATMAGVLQRRLIGPIWKKGTLVTEVWLGDPRDPEAGSEQDVTRALQVTVVVSCIAVVLGILLSGN